MVDVPSARGLDADAVRRRAEGETVRSQGALVDPRLHRTAERDGLAPPRGIPSSRRGPQTVPLLARGSPDSAAEAGRLEMRAVGRTTQSRTPDAELQASGAAEP